MTLPPELTGFLITLAITGATALYHKIKGDKQANLGDLLWPIIEGNALKLANSENTIDVIRLKLEAAAADGLKRLGFPANKITDAIVQSLIEQGVTEVRKQMIERINGKDLSVALDKTVALAPTVIDAFTPPVTPTVPKLDLAGAEIHVLCAYPGCQLDKDHAPPHRDGVGRELA